RGVPGGCARAVILPFGVLDNGAGILILLLLHQFPSLPEKHVPHSAEHKGGIVTPSISALSTSETIEYQAGDAGDCGEILVEGKNASAMFKSNGCNQGINRGERNASCMSRAVDRGRFPIG